MKYTPREIMEFVEQEDVKFIRLAFCNVYGLSLIHISEPTRPY